MLYKRRYLEAKRDLDAKRSEFSELKMKYEELQKVLYVERSHRRTLIHQYNNLEKQANDMYQRLQVKSDFSKKDINSMLMLCHPDKHDGKASAVRITQILLDMRKK